MKLKQLLFMMLGILTIASVGCNSGSKKNGGNNSDSTAMSKDAKASNQVVYTSHLQALNSDVTGTETTGDAKFVVANGIMTVTIDVKNAPPGIPHWQHFHGFKNDSAASIPTADADANGDGVIDLLETGKYSGTTMVPFNKMPSKMNVLASTYPVADENGSYHYEVQIPMDSLKAAFTKAFGGSDLDLDKRILYIHGVPEDTKLPESVASIADIPAQVTIPIAAGKIVKE